MTDLEESNRQLTAAWQSWARRCPSPVIANAEGLDIAFCGVPIPFFNFAVPDSPIRNWEALTKHVETAAAYGTEAGVPWMMPLCHQLLPGPPEEARGVMESAGMLAAMPLTGMIADALTPSRASELEFRQALDPETRAMIVELNSRAYDMSMEEGAGPLSAARMWDDEFGVVGFLEGQPVTAAATMNVEGRRYVCWVATLPQFQRRGFAGAVMRRSLELAADKMGPVRTVLHATEAGRPVYERMGYRAVAGYTVYTPGVYRTV